MQVSVCDGMLSYSFISSRLIGQAHVSITGNPYSCKFLGEIASCTTLALHNTQCLSLQLKSEMNTLNLQFWSQSVKVLDISRSKD